MPILDKISHALHLHKDKKEKDKKEPEPQPKSAEPAAGASAEAAPATAETTQPASGSAAPATSTSDQPASTPSEQPPPAMALTEEKKSQVFDKSKVTVIFVLGGPGAGKASTSRFSMIFRDHVARRQGHPMRQPRERLRLLPSLRYVPYLCFVSCPT